MQPKSTNSGVYLFIRTNKLAKADVVKALQEGRSVLANSYGQLKGVATNREVRFSHTVLVLRKESKPIYRHSCKIFNNVGQLL